MMYHNPASSTEFVGLNNAHWGARRASANFGAVMSRLVPLRRQPVARSVPCISREYP
jgi:hypothetical protein